MESEQNKSSETISKLFTPGPLNTSPSVKAAMMNDLGSRDARFMETVTDIRNRLLRVYGEGGVETGEYTAILLQGSGTYAVEAVLGTTLGKDPEAKALILCNGSYGQRMGKVCAQAEYNYQLIEGLETEPIDLQKVEMYLKEHGQTLTLVAFVHCETSTGLINPFTPLVHLIRKYSNADIMVDGMSSFGGMETPGGADFIVSSANKCIQGVPGFAFVIARLGALRKLQGRSRSVSLDIYDQWAAMERNGQFRFTPPTHSLLAFQQALKELDAEGGVEGRAKRYNENREILRKGMSEFGFKELLDPKYAGWIITSYMYPNDPQFTFERFYQQLSQRRQVIYPGKVTNLPSFRIGNIGDISPEDCRHLLVCIGQVLGEMNVKVPIHQ